MLDQSVAMIADERAALLGLLARVAGEDWSRPTPCEAWSVKDVLAHLVEGELNVGRVFRGELRESGYIDPHAGVAKWRALPGVAVRGAFWQHGSATQRVLEAMTDEARAAPIQVLGCRTIPQLVRLSLFDLAVHGHDLTEALGAEPIWADRLPFLVEYVVRAAPKTLGRRGIPPAGAVEVSAGGRAWVVAGDAGGWRLDATASASAAARLEADPEDLVLAVTGRMPVDAVLGRATVEGDADAARALLDGWQVVAT